MVLVELVERESVCFLSERYAVERVDLLGLSLDLDLDRDFECERDLLPTGDTEESDCEESWWRLRLLRFLDFLDDCLGGGDLDRDLHLLLDCELSSSVTELMERLRNTLPPDLRLRLADLDLDWDALLD